MILVTGASGLLGANFLSFANQRGREAVGVYHRHPVHLAGVKLLGADLMDRAEAERILLELSPAQIIHCAAATNVDWCETHAEEAARLNVAASATIADYAGRTGARLIYISTDAVFDGERGDYMEDDTPAPVNVYAQTKLRAEKEVLRRNPSTAIARVNLYGWNAQNKDSLAEWILKKLERAESVPGFPDVIFCPILVNHLAEALLEVLDQSLSGIYHLVGSEAVTKYEFARRLASEFGYDPAQIISTRSAEAKLQAPRPKNTSLNTGKITRALGRAMPSVNAGLRRFRELRESGYLERLKADLTGVPR